MPPIPPMDKFWDYAVSQGPGWVVAFLSICVVGFVFWEYNRREKMWRAREDKLSKIIDDHQAALSAEKDARREEALAIKNETNAALSGLVSVIQNLEHLIQQVNTTMIACQRK